MTVQTTDSEINAGERLSLDSLELCLAKASRTLLVNPKASIHFNLGRVRWLDIGSVLFLVCVLSHLKRRGVPTLLTLPEKDGSWQREPVVRVRDFLKRWQFDQALQEAIGDHREILPPHQEDYFDTDKQPLTFYGEGRMPDATGAITRLLSCRLVEITHMTRGPVGNKRVSEEEIDRFLASMSLKVRFRTAICEVLGFDDDAYQNFGSSIIYEALLNTYEHPEASLSMISMAYEGNTLVVAIADNGKTIPDTIWDEFQQDKAPPPGTPAQKDDLALLRLAAGEQDLDKYLELYRRDSEATDYATRPGTSSKKHLARSRRGFGLTDVKEKTLEFGGSCVFRSGAASVRYYMEEGKPVRTGRAVSWWPGNLVKIFLSSARQTQRDRRP